MMRPRIANGGSVRSLFQKKDQLERAGVEACARV